MKKISREFTLFGDLDGMTVAELRELLDDYPDDAVIDAKSTSEWGYGGTTVDREFFVFVIK
jgi:hypothetical protein